MYSLPETIIFLHWLPKPLVGLNIDLKKSMLNNNCFQFFSVLKTKRDIKLFLIICNYEKVNIKKTEHKVKICICQ